MFRSPTATVVVPDEFPCGRIMLDEADLIRRHLPVGWSVRWWNDMPWLHRPSGEGRRLTPAAWRELAQNARSFEKRLEAIAVLLDVA